MFPDTRPKLAVHVEQTGETYQCASHESLLHGMLRLGRRGIPAGCVNGGCGVCKVQVLEGQVNALGPMSRAHVTVEEAASGVALACRVAPITPVRLALAGRLVKSLA